MSPSARLRDTTALTSVGTTSGVTRIDSRNALDVVDGHQHGDYEGNCGDRVSGRWKTPKCSISRRARTYRSRRP
jgi:hypothetical protein